MFKDKLKKLRLSKGLTQEQLAEKLFVSRSAIAKWEQGRGLPHEDTMESIATFFDVDKDYFYDKNEPNILIEKLFFKKRVFQVIGIILAFVLIITFIAMINNRNDNSKIIKNEFYSNEYLKKMHLTGLESIFINNNNSMLYRSGYYVNIDSLEQFNDYALYVYTFLQNSLEVSYVGFSYDAAMEGDYSTRDPYDLRQYIKRSDKLTDYASYLNDSIYYTFYYLTSEQANHKKGEQIEPYIISLSYSTNPSNLGWGLKIDDNIEWNNFHMIINKMEKYTGSKYLYGVYLLDDYFEISETKLNNDEFFAYFDINIYKSSNDYVIMIIPNKFTFKYYFEANLSVLHNDSTITKSKIITRNNNDIRLDKQEIESISIDELKQNITITINNGYFYNLTPIS